MNHTATYSPEDDKLRLYPACRLDKDDFDRAKACGFRWAPKQELFYAVWSPAAEDLLIEWCEEITDEDKSLVDRAEERADRFEDYSANRLQDAEQAHKAVSVIADGIPLGQPILVGHHSERHARKDATRIENGMRKAVKMWQQSTYWKARAAGAIRHAKYKERPDVRARRIKTLEADLRKVLQEKDLLDRSLQFWTRDDITHDLALKVAGQTQLARFVLPRKEGDRPDWQHRCDAYAALTNDHPTLYAERTLGEVIQAGREAFPSRIAHCDRWIEHYSHRLEYEHAMLEEQGATKLLDKKPKSAAAQLPLCNYRAPEGLDIPNEYHRGEMIHYAQVEMAQADYAKIYQDYKGTRVVDNSHRVRTAVIRHAHVCVFLTDSKVHNRPAPIEPRPPQMPPAEVVEKQLEQARERQEKREAAAADAAPFETMRATLKAGVQVVPVPQLFPTPVDVARRMAELADLKPDHRVLEPSAGTGRLIDACTLAPDHWNVHEIVAVELSQHLACNLKAKYRSEFCEVIQVDFLSCNGNLGTFDRIVMNPPFENGADIKHILHARSFLKPGGRLVAICANGPRQQEKLKPLADCWEELEPGTFEGTGVRTVLLTIDAPPLLVEILEAPQPVEGERPVLGQTAAEAQRLLYGGRRTDLLRDAKVFDKGRLEDSPLFGGRQKTLEGF